MIGRWFVGFAVFVGYLCLGAFVFYRIERKEEEFQHSLDIIERLELKGETRTRILYCVRGVLGKHKKNSRREPRTTIKFVVCRANYIYVANFSNSFRFFGVSSARQCLEWHKKGPLGPIIFTDKINSTRFNLRIIAITNLSIYMAVSTHRGL